MSYGNRTAVLKSGREARTISRHGLIHINEDELRVLEGDAPIRASITRRFE